MDLNKYVKEILDEHLLSPYVSFDVRNNLFFSGKTIALTHNGVIYSVWVDPAMVRMANRFDPERVSIIKYLKDKLREIITAIMHQHMILRLAGVE